MGKMHAMFLKIWPISWREFQKYTETSQALLALISKCYVSINWLIMTSSYNTQPVSGTLYAVRSAAILMCSQLF